MKIRFSNYWKDGCFHLFEITPYCSYRFKTSHIVILNFEMEIIWKEE